MALQNLDIKDFNLVTTLNETDYVLLATSQGHDGKIMLSLVLARIVDTVKPSIDGDGQWLIGGNQTGVQAVGKTPDIRKTELGLEWKYTQEADSEWRLLVPWSDIKFTFADLTEEQVASLKLTLADLTEDDIKQLQQPAADMIAKLEETNTSVESAEAIRVANENARIENEKGRVSTESLRVDEENKRAQAESVREANEKIRKESETERASAEEERISNETARVAAENSRAKAETDRESNESSRKTAEDGRATAEEERVSNENARQTAEESRENAENIRINNESVRETEEDLRETNEQTRISNEESRINAENSRVTEHNELSALSVQATNNANQAATQARKLPYISGNTWWVYDITSQSYLDSGVSATGRSPQIRNSTWWVWNDETGEYVDTGQSVSSEFVLTKANIESVLTGTIKTHEHPVYEAQVYEETPDFENLVSFMREGVSINFVAGNDIYVRDDSESSGYANYKLAHTTGGTAWVRIPQAKDGYSFLLVKNRV